MEVEEERQLAAGGVMYRRAGCLLIPFVPVRAAGALIVTTRRIIFDPVLHYKLVARKLSIDLDQVGEAEASGGNVEMSLMDLVLIGKALMVKLKNGRRYNFRSMQADELAEAINEAVRLRRE